jgi:hypothetical protein
MNHNKYQFFLHNFTFFKNISEALKHEIKQLPVDKFIKN